MNPAHILLVDDEAITLSNLTHVLKREGYEVTACKNGEAGLAALREHDFDLVLTDLKMPGVDGMELLREVRSRWELPRYSNWTAAHIHMHLGSPKQMRSSG